LDGLPPYAFREKYGCDCVDEGEGEEILGDGALSKEERMKEAAGPSI
jgi:endoribonuclease Dicer